jgi:hypothetical protein
MTHKLEFKTVNDMVMWLVDNDIDDMRVDLIIHLEESPCNN